MEIFTTRNLKISILTILFYSSSDLLQNPLIVPVKVLRGHQRVNDLGVLDCVFHPTQPWLISAGADATLRLYS